MKSHQRVLEKCLFQKERKTLLLTCVFKILGNSYQVTWIEISYEKICDWYTIIWRNVQTLISKMQIKAIIRTNEYFWYYPNSLNDVI